MRNFINLANIDKRELRKIIDHAKLEKENSEIKAHLDEILKRIDSHEKAILPPTIPAK